MEKEHLATASQVALAKKSLDDAQAVYVSQLAQQSNRTLEKIKAPFDGVISNNIAMLGERLNMGQPILSIFKESELKAVFGVNPKHLKNVKIGQKVEITSVFDSGSKLSSKIQKISGMINPQTRLIDIIVPIPTANNTLWLSGIQIRGTIVLNEEAFFTVAKSTILSDTDGSFIFQIKNTKAVKVAVRRLREQNGFVAISGDFDPLLKVIHEGNYELSSGMTIRENRR